MSLNISKQFILPIDAITETLAILAKRRVGKTYTASVIAEEFIKNKLPFVALDPTGAWWGLQSSKDGKEAGFPVYILGGDHGIALEPTAGKVIAEQVVKHPSFYVVDVSKFKSNAEQDRFATDFAEHLYRIKADHPEPLHLFIDEADAFIPQRPFGGQQRMLGAFEALVRRGGIRGIGVTLISQRAAVINKNVLTQTECMIILRTTSPQDRNAIDEWIKLNGTEEERKILLSSLAKLQQSEAWIYSPGWLEVCEKINIRERITFNSSRTPKVGEKKINPVLAKVNIDKLSKEIHSTIEKQKENEPAALKKKIRDLELLIQGASKKKSNILDNSERLTKANEDIKKLREENKQLEKIGASLESDINRFQDKIKKLADYFSSLFKGFEFNAIKVAITAKKEFDRAFQKTSIFGKPPIISEEIKYLDHQVIVKNHKADKKMMAESTDDFNGDLPAGARKILIAIAQYPDGIDRNQIAVLTAYRSTSRYEYLRKLKAAGYIIGSDKRYLITETGIDYLGSDYEPLPTGNELREYWLNNLPAGELRLFEGIIEVYSDSISKNRLSELTGYKSTSIYEYLRLLRNRKLIVKQGNEITASENLF